jgi:dTMP kinase
VDHGRCLRAEDRTTPTGKMINGYLTGNAQQDDHSIHLLFSANRWEAIHGILKDISEGVTVIIDRYSFSGAVYSAAKDNPNLGLPWGMLDLI